MGWQSITLQAVPSVLENDDLRVQRTVIPYNLPCSRIDPFSRKPLRDIHLNDMTEPMYEEGESIRPSVPPKQALSTVLSQLKDEFHHLQLYSHPSH